MLWVYVSCLLIGGAFVGLSALIGAGEGDLDTLEAERVGPSDSAWLRFLVLKAWWLPLLSVRFWTHGVAFFGLAGTIFHGLGLASPGAAFGLALGVGVGAGYAVAGLVQLLHRRQVSSAVDDATDYLGRPAEVLLDVLPGDPGQVRVEVKGALVDLSAELVGDEPLRRGERVVVTGVAGDGTTRVQVTRPD